MKKIVQLPKHISDKIAAGEVVTGPVSVVKELVENSIDALSRSITVEIKNGGRTYIRVTDDGRGIPNEDMELAFMAHATSKIRDEKDLDRIKTLGFRGEALTSIAAVSMIETLTKTAQEKLGTIIYIEGGEIIEKKYIGTNTGTTVIVKNLYYNTPARLKFMKSDGSESRKISDFVSRIAIAYPDIRIKFINNGNILFSTNGKGEVLNNIIQIFGIQTSSNLLEIRNKNEKFELHAYISTSDNTKKTRKGQLYFVNGRVVDSKIIEKGISKGYEDFIFEGRHPIVFLFLNTEPSELDVNVHPAKTEIRFREQQAVIDFIQNTIHDRLKNKDAIPDIINNTTFKLEDRVDKDIYKDESKDLQSESETDTTVEHVNINMLLSSYKTKEEKSNNIIGETDRYDYDFSEAQSVYTNQKNNTSNMLDISSLNALGTIFATYILAEDGENFYIIDQHAAHERINYELFLDQYKTGDTLSQQLIEPILIDLSVTVMSEIDVWIEFINKLGYEAEIFGDRTVVIKATPAFISYNDAEKMIYNILDNIGDIVPENEKAIDTLIQRSCKMSVKANDKLKIEEIIQLLSDLSKCKNPFSCPHGRPVFTRLSKHDIEKLFRRV